LVHFIYIRAVINIFDSGTNINVKAKDKKRCMAGQMSVEMPRVV